MESRRIVITGATPGLGLAMAEEFLRLGHTVLGCGRNAEAVANLQRLHGPQGRFATVDISDAEQVHAWAQQSLASHGPPDLLVNNAALMHRNAPLWETPTAEFDDLIDVNVKGVANAIRAFVPAMVERGSGVIVNFSSYWGRSTAPNVAGYCASKWAIEGLTRSLAQNLPKGMAAVPFNPGIIDTDMLRSTFGDKAGKYIDPKAWAATTVPFLLDLGPKDNGKPLTAPGQ